MLFPGTYEETLAIINAIGTPVYLVNVSSEDRFINLACNYRAEEFFGVSNETFAGRDLEDLEGLSDMDIFRVRRGVVAFRQCIERASPVTLEFQAPKEAKIFRWGRLTFVPIFSELGKVDQIMVTVTDITELKETQASLENALTRVLSGFVMICATCKNIKEDSDQWVPVERYLTNDANDVHFSHGYCPNCYEMATRELR